MIGYAIRDSAAEAIQAGVTPQTGDCDALWAITWRTAGRLDGAAALAAGKRPDLNTSYPDRTPRAAQMMRLSLQPIRSSHTAQ